jgi:hypothetical protein
MSPFLAQSGHLCSSEQFPPLGKEDINSGTTQLSLRVRLRTRANILAMSEALERHAAYFDSGAAR